MKKIYIYDYIPDLTGNWHPEGGLVVITSGEPKHPIEGKHLPEPTQVIEIGEASQEVEEAVYVFPDAGCC